MEANRRRITILLELPKIYYQFATVFMLLLTNTDFFKGGWIWHLAKTFNDIPTKLLAWPIKATVVLLIFSRHFPSFPNDNTYHTILIIYLHLANSIMLGNTVRVHCFLYEYQCYEEHPLMPGDEDVATQLMFFVLQVFITINMAFAAWFIKSMRQVIYAGITQFVNFFVREFFILMLVGNFVFVVTINNLQNPIILIMILFITCNFAVELFLINPLIDFIAFDMAMFLEDYEVDDAEVVTNPQAYNPHRNQVQFMDALEPDD